MEKTLNPERLSGNIPSVLTICFSGAAFLYFIARAVVRRSPISLAITLMCSGWSACALVMTGYFRGHFDAVSWMGLIASGFMLVSIVLNEFWDDHERMRLKAEELAEEDARLKGKQ